MRLLDNYDNYDKNIIRVNTILKIDYLTFSFEDKDTIWHLKKEIGTIMNCAVEEQNLIIGEKYPYPLSNDLYLYHLLEDHRILTVVISENPKKVVPSRLIEKRNISYVTNREVPYFNVLNLKDIYYSDIEYIELWIDDMKHRLIEVDYASFYFDYIMKSINDILEKSLDYQPCQIKALVIYNRDINNLCSEKEKLIDEFIYKIQSYNCYSRTKIIYK